MPKSRWPLPELKRESDRGREFIPIRSAERDLAFVTNRFLIRGAVDCDVMFLPVSQRIVMTRELSVEP